MCSTAFAFASRAFAVLPNLAVLRCCQEQKAVHMGDPISKYGRCLRRISRALSRLALTLKSQGLPSSGSLTVMSKARPGVRNSFLDFAISAVTLGGE